MAMNQGSGSSVTDNAGTGGNVPFGWPSDSPHGTFNGLGLTNKHAEHLAVVTGIEPRAEPAPVPELRHAAPLPAKDGHTVVSSHYRKLPD
jgi:hypothetical protein